MLPSLSDYMTTFQNPQLFLVDKELAQCKCPKDQLGQPLVESGGFALTFKLVNGNSRWAVRCFHQPSPDRERRYGLITNTLMRPALAQSGYFVKFEYQAEGIVVRGQKYPVVKMSWAEGETLGSFLESHYGSRTHLRNLQAAIRKLRSFLEANGIAHGDIQPGNLMVSADGTRVQLIDYDGMFVPGMESLNSAEAGVPNFQHPKRQQVSPWNNKLDRFPFIVIDLVLTILADDPTYWQKTKSSDEKFLFDASDYIAPLGSSIFNELKRNPKYSQAIASIQQICLSDFDAIPSFDDYIGFKASQQAVANAAKTISVQIRYMGAHQVFCADDISAISLQEGKVVEIVGKVLEVKNGKTKYGKPYCFVNFTNWKNGRTHFRIVLWSEILAKYAQAGVGNISNHLIGKCVSITGLIVKFSNKWGDSFQFAPKKISEIALIDDNEMIFRLGKITKTVNQKIGETAPAKTSPKTSALPQKQTNAQKLQTFAHPACTTSTANKSNRSSEPTRRSGPFQGKTKPPATNQPTVPSYISSFPSPIPGSNAQKLATMKKSWQGSVVSGRPTTTRQPFAVSNASSKAPSPSSKSSTGCLMPLVAIIASLVILGAAIAASLK